METRNSELRTQNSKLAFRRGSALIMTIVITVLLAIVGTLFMLMARVDKIATSHRSDSEELKLAVDTVVANIAETLTDGTPGRADANGVRANYFDYPATFLDKFHTVFGDPWLAVLEPNVSSLGIISRGGSGGPSGYGWSHVSDLYKKFTLAPDAPAQILNDYQSSIEIGDSNNSMTYIADADGDGVSDSKWVKIPNLTTSKGQPVYAAIRIIDNSAMLNLNTAYKFDPNAHRRDSNPQWVDGSSQVQINLQGLAYPTDKVDPNGAALDGLHLARAADTRMSMVPTPPAYLDDKSSSSQTCADNFKTAMIWLVDSVNGAYGTPFDISDELDLRNRFFLQTLGTARVGQIWDNTITNSRTLQVPFDNTTDNTDPNKQRTAQAWYARLMDPNLIGLPRAFPDRRHLLTTLNLDRIIDDQGNRMFTVNDHYGTPQQLYLRLLNAVTASLKTTDLPRYNYLSSEICQLAVNLWDYTDADSNVTCIHDTQGLRHYGLERPCVWISELTRRAWAEPCSVAGLPTDPFGPRDPNRVHHSYGIELYKSYSWQDLDTFEGNWRIVIDSNAMRTKPIYLTVHDFNDYGGEYYVKLFEDPLIPEVNDVKRSDPGLPYQGELNVDPNHIFPVPEYPLDPNESPAGYATNFYFGTDPNAANDPLVATHNWTTAPTSFKPAPAMTPGQKYYYRVEVTLDGNSVRDSGLIWFEAGNKPPEDTNSIGVGTLVFDSNTTVLLERRITDMNDPNRPVNNIWVVVDSVKVPRFLYSDANVVNDKAYWSPNVDTNSERRSFSRDLYYGQLIRRMWDPNSTWPTLGHWNAYACPDANYIQFWPRNGDLYNVGEAALMFGKPAYYEPNMSPEGVIGYEVNSVDPNIRYQNKYERNVRINMADPNIQRVFQYLTVLNPDRHLRNWSTIAYDGNYPETRVKGRININTAPWQLIAQLPWVSLRGTTVPSSFDKNALAKAIVAYRDKQMTTSNGRSISYSDVNAPGARYGREYGMYGTTSGLTREELGFEDVGELLSVINLAGWRDFDIRYYGMDGHDQAGYPDLTSNDWWGYGDGIADDMEEQQLIFARISDLVTVRSDLFTAYILVRLGQDGPQRRMIAVLDRSGVTPSGGAVKIVALQPVPDPR
jgi:hypothetical protein